MSFCPYFNKYKEYANSEIRHGKNVSYLRIFYSVRIFPVALVVYQ